MKRKTILTLSAIALTAAIGAATLPAIAGGPGQWGPGAGFGMADGHRGPGMMMRHGGHGPMGMPGMGLRAMGMKAMADNPVYLSFDADGDGTVSAAELETGLTARHADHDADGDGTLSEDEFAALFAEVTRGFAERPFVMLDADQDGRLSAEEMVFPARMMARMQAWHGLTPDANAEDR